MRSKLPEIPGPMDDVPGANADTKTLREHYTRWLCVTACRSYDNRIWSCGWCARMDVDLLVSHPAHPRAEPMFCSKECAAAKAAHEESLPKPRVSPEAVERALEKDRKQKRRSKSGDSYGHGAVKV